MQSIMGFTQKQEPLANFNLLKNVLMVSWLACPITSSVIERVWAPDGSNQKLFYKIWICCFSAKHASFWRKSTDCFAQNQNNCVWVEQHAYPWIHCCNKNNLLSPHLYTCSTFSCRHAAVISCFTLHSPYFFLFRLYRARIWFKQCSNGNKNFKESG